MRVQNVKQIYLEPLGLYMPAETALELLKNAVQHLRPENMEQVEGATVEALITAAFILTEEGRPYRDGFMSGAS